MSLDILGFNLNLSAKYPRSSDLYYGQWGVIESFFQQSHSIEKVRLGRFIQQQNGLERGGDQREEGQNRCNENLPVVAIMWCRVGNHDENTNFSPLKCQKIQLMQKVYWNDALENIKQLSKFSYNLFIQWENIKSAVKCSKPRFLKFECLSMSQIL